MSTTPVPDIIGAVTSFLNGLTQTSLCQSRVAPVLADDWIMPNYAIVVTPAGGPGPLSQIGRQVDRLDLRFYGAGKAVNIRRRTARDLWRTVHPALCPIVNSGRRRGFVAQHCRVDDVVQASSPIPMLERTEWALVIVSYLFEWHEVPTA